MNFFKEFWQFFAGDEGQQLLAAKRNKPAHHDTQVETVYPEPDDEQCCDDDLFEAD